MKPFSLSILFLSFLSLGVHGLSCISEHQQIMHSLQGMTTDEIYLSEYQRGLLMVSNWRSNYLDLMAGVRRVTEILNVSSDIKMSPEESEEMYKDLDSFILNDDPVTAFLERHLARIRPPFDFVVEKEMPPLTMCCGRQCARPTVTVKKWDGYLVPDKESEFHLSAYRFGVAVPVELIIPYNHPRNVRIELVNKYYRDGDHDTHIDRNIYNFAYDEVISDDDDDMVKTD